MSFHMMTRLSCRTTSPLTRGGIRRHSHRGLRLPFMVTWRAAPNIPKKTLGAQRTKQSPPRLHKHGELPVARRAPSRAPEPRRHNQQLTPGVPKTSWEPGLPRHSEGVSRTTTRETSGPQRSETARSNAAAGTRGKTCSRQSNDQPQGSTTANKRWKLMLKALLPANLPRFPHRRRPRVLLRFQCPIDEFFVRFLVI